MKRTKILAFAIAALWLLTPTAQAADDIMWRCTSPNGPDFYGNDKGRVPKGYKCKPMFTMGSRKAPADTAAAGSTEKKKTRPRWTPPKAPKTVTPAAGPVAPAPAVAAPTEMDEIIRAAAEANNLPEAFIRAVITVESSYKVRALSHKGAMGLMQLMPGTARDLGVTDPYDAYQNIMGGSKFLRILADRFDGDLIKVISAYHAGGGVTSRKDGTPWVGTDGYVRKVLKNYYRIKAELATR